FPMRFCTFRMVISYEKEQSARLALTRDGAIIQGVMIGVKLTDQHEIPAEFIATLRTEIEDELLNELRTNEYKNQQDDEMHSEPSQPFRREPDTSLIQNSDERYVIKKSEIETTEHVIQRRVSFCKRIMQMFQ